MTWEKIKIWEDQEGKLWTLADAGSDAEIFELLGGGLFTMRLPVYGIRKSLCEGQWTETHFLRLPPFAFEKEQSFVGELSHNRQLLSFLFLLKLGGFPTSSLLP